MRLERDKEDMDRYQSLLRYVFLEDDTMVNQVLVQEGHGTAKFYSPNTKYKKLFEGLQDKARSDSRGKWGACKQERSEDQEIKMRKRKH